MTTLPTCKLRGAVAPAPTRLSTPELPAGRTTGDHPPTAAHDRLRRLADHDPLSGLLNRRGFQGELDGHLARCRRHGATGSLHMLDVDGPTGINDSLGHAAGDAAIVGVAGSLPATCARPT